MDTNEQKYLDKIIKNKETQQEKDLKAIEVARKTINFILYTSAIFLGVATIAIVILTFILPSANSFCTEISDFLKESIKTIIGLYVTTLSIVLGFFFGTKK